MLTQRSPHSNARGGEVCDTQAAASELLTVSLGSSNLGGVPNDGFNNTHLTAARSAKNDEFYTQWVDIEREMNAYLEYDSECFATR